jgi:hypothetical protein
MGRMKYELLMHVLAGFLDEIIIMVDKTGNQIINDLLIPLINIA